jgi:hydroxyacylglutathione hydrolase
MASASSSSAQLTRISALDDNYIWLLSNPSSHELAIIDPGEAGPVLAWLDEHGMTPTEIINTHHHGDHINGNAELAERYGIPLTGPASETARINGMKKMVAGSDHLTIAGYSAQVIDTPGHTTGHVAFYLPDCFGDHGVAFVGDTLFSMGCGRVFEGSMAEMWSSLAALRQLPDDTIICCGHEYTASNARYVAQLGWQTPSLETKLAEIKTLTDQGKPTVPVRLGDEKAANPFLCADDPALAKALGCDSADAVEVFTALRSGKDNFRG